MRLLANRPTAAKLLRDRLLEISSKDIFNDDPKRVAKLIEDLDNDDFNVRDRATNDLRNLGKLAVPSIRKALDANPEVDAKQRLSDLLSDSTKTAPEMLRIGRALEVLELMNAADSRPALETLVKESRTSWLRDAASASLRRLR